MSSLKSTAKDAKKKKSITPKKPAKKASPPPNLSSEFVEESDLEEDEGLNEASTSDDEESLPDNPAQPVPKSKSKPVVAAATSGSESESAEDSDSEDAEDEDEEPSNAEEKSSVASKFAKYVLLRFQESLAYSIADQHPVRKRWLSRHHHTNLLMATS